MDDRSRARTPALLRQLGLAVGGMAILVVCGLLAHDGKVGTPERRVFRAINDLPGWLYHPLWPFQQFGNIVIALLVTVAVALLLRRWWVAVAAVAAVVAKSFGEKVVKHLVQRHRPGTSIGLDIDMRGDVPATGLSFVSGHAVLTAAMAGLLTPVLRGRWKVVPWIVVALNGITRIYVGAHNPLDIAGGIGLGLFIAGVLNLVLLGVSPPHPGDAASAADRTAGPDDGRTSARHRFGTRRVGRAA